MIRIILAIALSTLYSLSVNAAVISNNDGTFNVGSTQWVNDGNVNYDSDDYSCFFNFVCNGQAVGLTTYGVAVLVAENTCAGCRLPTAAEYLELSREDLNFLSLVPNKTYWAVDESGNPFLFGSPVVDLSTSTEARAEGLFGVMAVRDVSAVPLPSAFWLMISGLAGIIGVSRKVSK